MDLRDMHVGRFYAIDNVPRIFDAADYPVGTVLEVLAKGVDTVSVRNPRTNNIQRIKAVRFRLPTLKELFPVEARVMFKDNVNAVDFGNHRRFPGNPGWVADFDRAAAARRQFTIRLIEANGRWARMHECENNWAYDLRWLRRVGEVVEVQGEQAIFEPPRPIVEPAPAFIDAAPVAAEAVVRAEPRRFMVGDKVRLKNQDKYGGEWSGEMVIVRLGDPHAFVTLQHPEHGMGRFNLNEIELMPKKVAAKFAVGDKVQVAKKLDDAACQWRDEMDKSVGKTYTINKLGNVKGKDVYRLSNGWWYLAGSLSVPKKVEKVPTMRERIAAVRKMALAKERLSTSSYVVIAEKNGVIKEFNHLDDVCHYRIQAGHRWDKLHAIIDFVHDVKNGKIDKELIPWAKKYADYIVNRSPFSIGFIKKQGRSVIDNGAEVNIKAPLSIIAGGLIAMRTMREWNRSLEVFKIAIEGGVSEHSAFLLMHCISPDGKGHLVRRPEFGGHQSISSSQRVETLAKLFANGYPEKALKALPAEKDTSSYKVVQTMDMWAGSGEYVSDWVRQNVKETVVGEGFERESTVEEVEVVRAGKMFDEIIEKAKQ